MNPPDDHKAYIESLYQELEAIKIRIAFAEMDSAQELQPTASDDAAYSDAGFQKALSAMDRLTNRDRRKDWMRQMLPHVAYAATALLFVFYLSHSTSSIATEQPVRVVQEYKLTASKERRFLRFGIQPVEGTAMEVPVGWDGLYFPTYIPEGYEVFAVYGQPFCHIEYKDKEGNQLFFWERDLDAPISFNLNHSTVYETTIRNHPAFVSVEDSSTTVIWSIDNRCFIVEIHNRDEKIALQIANSVWMID